ncbi:hypothetical protein [Streptomyces sp. MRC013]|nr:hypothetical protein [Streptomyces sp. MRC013]
MSSLDTRTLRRLRRTMLFSLIRGAATAAGGAAVTALVWWVQHR